MSVKSKNGSDTKAVVDDYELILAQERLVIDAQIAINRLLRRADLQQSDLAMLLGVSDARLSQMLSENARNLTLRSLARIFHVLGTRCRIFDDAELKEAATTLAEAAPQVVRNDENAEGVTSVQAASSYAVPSMDAGSTGNDAPLPRAADVWLLSGHDLRELLSEDAPFGGMPEGSEVFDVKSKSAHKRPFGKKQGDEGDDRFAPKLGRGVVVISAKQRRKLVIQPSANALEFMRRADRATSVGLELVESTYSC